MRVVIQRVLEASVQICGKKRGEIKHGLLVFLGIEETDTEQDIEWLTGKISRLRIFDDTNGLMNLSIREIKGSILVVSQFTLHASIKKGNRPSYIQAARPDFAKPMYEKFIQKLKDDTAMEVQTGEFGAEMIIKLINNGPVTIIIDTKNKY